MTFFDPLKPDRPEFDDIEQDAAKTIVFVPKPGISVEDLVFPAQAEGRGSKVTRFPDSPRYGASLNELLLNHERAMDEAKPWWKRLWPW